VLCINTVTRFLLLLIVDSECSAQAPTHVEPLLQAFALVSPCRWCGHTFCLRSASIPLSVSAPLLVDNGYGVVAGRFVGGLSVSAPVNLVNSFLSLLALLSVTVVAYELLLDYIQLFIGIKYVCLNGRGSQIVSDCIMHGNHNLGRNTLWHVVIMGVGVVIWM